ncbi:MAG: hypothetical protein ACKO86_27280, partial [Dolichospermum sp.]
LPIKKPLLRGGVRLVWRSLVGIFSYFLSVEKDGYSVAFISKPHFVRLECDVSVVADITNYTFHPFYLRPVGAMPLNFFCPCGAGVLRPAFQSVVKTVFLSHIFHTIDSFFVCHL